MYTYCKYAIVQINAQIHEYAISFSPLHPSVMLSIMDKHFIEISEHSYYKTIIITNMIGLKLIKYFSLYGSVFTSGT